MDAELLRRLYARVPLGMRLGLEGMQEACARAGHPERSFAVVHVAGTNGKGSVSAMIDTMIRAAGQRCGLYTSPHLTRFAERIRIDGEPIDDGALEACLADALDLGPALSFFETATLAAFLAFRTARVPWAVLEVGLGGRLDATNVVPAPRVGVISRIALDHTAMLGETLAAIAREKAGIAKAGMTVVTAPGDAEVNDALDAALVAAGARSLPVRDHAAAGAMVEGARLALAGEHQRDNARLAAAVGYELGLSDDAIRGGLETVRWPGRLERLVTNDGVFLLDAAHNPDGAEALAQHLAALPGPKVMVFGALADKAWEPMLDRLAEVSVARHYAPPRGRAATAPSTLAARHPGAQHDDVRSALHGARAEANAMLTTGAPPLVVVCGSIYLVGEARGLLLGLPEDPPVAL